MESLRVLGHPRSNRGDQVACLSKTQVANTIFVFLIKKTGVSAKVKKSQNRNFLLANTNDFKINLIGLIIKIEENEIKKFAGIFPMKTAICCFRNKIIRKIIFL